MFGVVGDKGGLVDVLAKFKLAFDLYVVCEDEFSFDQRLVRRSFVPDVGVITCGIFCFNLLEILNKKCQYQFYFMLKIFLI